MNPVQPNDPTKQPDAPTGDALPTTLPDRPTDSTPPPISPPPANDPFPTSVPDPTSPPPAPDTKDDKTESLLPPVIPPPTPSRSKAKIVGAILAVLVLVVSIPVGVFLVQRQQEIRERAQEIQATLTASPNPVPAGSGNGTTTITWSGAPSTGQVRVYEPTGNTVCSPTNQCHNPSSWEGASGSFTFTTVESGHTYIFSLYKAGCTKADCSDQGTPLKSLTVTRSTEGTLTASPNPVPAGSGNGKTTISWDTGGPSGQVWVIDTTPGANGQEVIFADDATKGSQETKNPDGTGWIQTGHTYTFKLYGGKKTETTTPPVLKSIEVTRTAGAGGTLTASPNPLSAGGNGITTISWNAGNNSTGQVWVIDTTPGANGEEVIFADDATIGSKETKNADGTGWIATGHTYTFKLYRGKKTTATTPILASIEVTRPATATTTAAPAPTSPPVGAAPTATAKPTSTATATSMAKGGATATPSLPVAGVSWPGVAAAIGGTLLLVLGLLFAF